MISNKDFVSQKSTKFKKDSLEIAADISELEILRIHL